MISKDEALHLLAENQPQQKTENLALEESFGCRLASDIYAPEPSPRFTSSAMDGFCVRSADSINASSEIAVVLKVVGESSAGVPFEGEVKQGEAIQISTGAMVPASCDAVLRKENCEDNGGTITIDTPLTAQKDVRIAGEEFLAGTLLLHKGSKIGSSQAALLASMGLHRVEVFAKPRVALLVTGTELRNYQDESIEAFQIRDSNAPMLKCAVESAGASCVSAKHASDDLESTIEAIQKHRQAGSEVIICSGGVSVGKHDHVKDAAIKAGFETLFWKVSQKPGKPLFVAKKNNCLLFGLPGNPVAAFVCFHVYVRPILDTMQGISSSEHQVTAVLQEGIENKGSMTNIMRMHLENKGPGIVCAKPVSEQRSHMLSGLVKADSYLELTPGKLYAKGDLVELVLFD